MYVFILFVSQGLSPKSNFETETKPRLITRIVDLFLIFEFRCCLAYRACRRHDTIRSVLAIGDASPNVYVQQKTVETFSGGQRTHKLVVQSTVRYPDVCQKTLSCGFKLVVITSFSIGRHLKRSTTEN